MDTPGTDPWIDRLARLFLEHASWQDAARKIDRRATSTIFFTHRPGQPWHLERRGDETHLLPGAARDPDFVLRFPPGAIARLEAVHDGAGAFAAELFELMLTADPETHVDLRIVAPFRRLLLRGYVRLLLTVGSRVAALRRRHGIVGVKGVARLVALARTSRPEAWETEQEPAGSHSPRRRGAV